ncbi:hypothetical protein BPAE_0032g00050 [Botrytis paeoniae]|uniref:Uncharacterized protein n=1 Tax=Botrytis paeoniae TaxID=278948 RepID=A0A4Z1G1E9_9HELO|nr:hypothetical protein BPAE_0032g00050 [Botrytis paeoniae]
MNEVRYIIAEVQLFEGEINDRSRLFWNKLQNPVNPHEIERMTKAKDAARKVCKHKSEDQWNVPRHSKTHFLNFPRDILNIIFKHALVALPGNVISPNLLATNWKKRYIEPSHKIYITGQDFEPYYSNDGHRPWPYNPSYFENSLLYIQRKTLHDKKGKYVELQRILRSQIDATLLHTCKVFHEIGSTLLYRHNTFHFGMANESMEKSSPSWIGNGHIDLSQANAGSTKVRFPKPSSAKLSSHQFRGGVTTIPSFVSSTTFDYVTQLSLRSYDLKERSKPMNVAGIHAGFSATMTSSRASNITYLSLINSVPECMN